MTALILFGDMVNVLTGLIVAICVTHTDLQSCVSHRYWRCHRKHSKTTDRPLQLVSAESPPIAVQTFDNDTDNTPVGTPGIQILTDLPDLQHEYNRATTSTVCSWHI